MHWAIVLGVLVLLFGAKKLPDMARSVGQSARVLKGEMRGLREDTPKPATATTAIDPAPGVDTPVVPVAPADPAHSDARH